MSRCKIYPLDRANVDEVRYAKACKEFNELLKEYNIVNEEYKALTTRRNSLVNAVGAAKIHKNRSARKLAESGHDRP